MSKRYIIVVGTIDEGFKHYGYWGNLTDLACWAERNGLVGSGRDWQAVEMFEPSQMFET